MTTGHDNNTVTVFDHADMPKREIDNGRQTDELCVVRVDHAGLMSKGSYLDDVGLLTRMLNKSLAIHLKVKAQCLIEVFDS